MRIGLWCVRMEISMSGMYCVDKVKLCVAAVRNRLQRRTMMCGQWEVLDAMHHRLVVVQEANVEGGPEVVSGNSFQHNGVQLFPLDAVLQQCLGPPPVAL